MTNLGKWDHWYEGLTHPEAYGDTVTYMVAAAAFDDCATIEDWGCGKGFLRTVLPAPERYRGIDGSHTPFADVIADLTTYTSTADGVLLRHVLEHNYEWDAILRNACETAQKVLVVVLFTPVCPGLSHQIAYNPDPGVPDISFNLDDLVGMFPADFVVETETFLTGTQYGVETVITGRRS